MVSVASVPAASASPMAPHRKSNMKSLNASTHMNSLSIVQPTRWPTHHQPIDQSSAQCFCATRYIGRITLINTIWIVILGCCPFLKSSHWKQSWFSSSVPQQSCLSLINTSTNATALHQKQQGRNNAEEEHSHQLLLCLQPHWWVGGLVLHTGLEGNQIMLILCFIVTYMYSNLLTKFGLIW